MTISTNDDSASPPAHPAPSKQTPDPAVTASRTDAHPVDGNTQAEGASSRTRAAHDSASTSKSPLPAAGTSPADSPSRSTPIFRAGTTLDALNALSASTAITQLGIEFIELGADFVRATMPVDARTRQPYGLLHGGASVLLAETLGSTAGNLCVPADRICVGLEINANHLRAVRDGQVTGTARPLHIGSRTQVWEIRIEDARGRLACISRLTLAVVERPSAG